ncbi:MAG: multiheme c-type cytochrome, partial [Nitrospinota bacterium]
MKPRKAVLLIVILLLAAFLVHRLTRPLLFFEVTDAFERPMSVVMPKGLESQSSAECAVCHDEIAAEWETTIHANAWKDPYFQVDFVYDGSLQVCLNCHTPLENQQENLVIGFNDSDKLDPIFKPNPNFSAELRDEGVTCVVCHVVDGVIEGPFGAQTDAHPTRKDERFTDGSGVCKKCHWVTGDRWDMFLKLPPCGNFAEIEEAGKKPNCTKCHMPKVTRPAAIGGPEREVGRHLFRGGHDAKMVKSAIKIVLKNESVPGQRMKRFKLSLTNTGAAHRLPTGTPDRHLEITFKLLDAGGNVIRSEEHILQRTILWRPFIIDLWDTRIKSGETTDLTFSFGSKPGDGAAFVEARVRYGLLHEKRRKLIGYEN